GGGACWCKRPRDAVRPARVAAPPPACVPLVALGGRPPLCWMQARRPYLGGVYATAAVTFLAASVRSVAACIVGMSFLASVRSLRPASTLVPSRRTTRGTLKPTLPSGFL